VTRSGAWATLCVGPMLVTSACGLSRSGEGPVEPLGVGADSGIDDGSGAGGEESAGDDGGNQGFGFAGADADAGDSGRSLDSGDAARARDSTSDGPELSDSGSCDFNGTWASRLTMGVSWVPQGLMGVILAPGSGQIRQWIKGVRVQTGNTAIDTTVVCGIALPDFTGTSIAGGETYGVSFPDSLFDNGLLPTFTVNATVSGFAPGATYTTTPTAALVGMTMASPTTTAWPATVTTAVDSDKDGYPGVTIEVDQGGNYSDVPVDFVKSGRADHLFVVIRQVTVVTGTVLNCDHMSGSVTIPRIPNTSAGKYAIDSHVVGCQLTGGTGTCNSTQTSFIDGTQPVFTPSGAGSFVGVRMPSGATCADVRAQLP
jgi:hypothetical protein